VKAKIAAVVVASLVAATAGAGSAAPTAPAARQTYADPVGDASCCVDIAGVTVSNDAAGLLTFRVELPNQPVAEPARIVGIWIDADLDPITGAGLPVSGRNRGGDYSIRLDATGDPVAALTRYPTTLTSPVFVGAVEASYDRGWTMRVDRRLLGAPASFDFYVVGLRYETDRPELVDAAPDLAQGRWGWRYDTELPPLVTRPTVTAGRLTVTPSRPRAGQVVTARLPFRVAPAGTRAGLRCGAAVAGRALRASRVANGGGAATCAWIVPRSARGKLVRGSVTVTVGRASATRRFSARVR
jgi:hypothetical protein